METFEIHITGDETINSELDSMGIKNIIVELLTPSQDLLLCLIFIINWINN